MELFSNPTDKYEMVLTDLSNHPSLCLKTVGGSEAGKEGKSKTMKVKTSLSEAHQFKKSPPTFLSRPIPILIVYFLFRQIPDLTIEVEKFE
jgi:hypothetical protein